MTRHARMTFLGSVAFAAAFFLKATMALAADQELPAKAPPPPPPPPSNWSAFLGITQNWGEVNPQGQAIYKLGDYNIAGGADLTLYRNKTGFINSWSIGVLGVVDITDGTYGPSDSIWANSSPTQDGSGLALILNAHTAITFGQVWTLTEGFYHLTGINANGGITDANNASGAVQPNANCTQNPPGFSQLGCADLPAWYWNELKLGLNDGALTHWAISFNPYVTWWHNFYGSGWTGTFTTTTSASCFSCNSEGDDFIIGMTPTLGLAPFWHIPLTLSAPTWVTVGPKSFWAGNSGTGPGSGCTPFTPGPNCSNGNVGVFTTGLTATWALTSIPVQYGHWNIKGGFQWYDIINTALQGDNDVTYGASFGLKQYITTGFLGVGVGF
jgi:hypothetical protein